LCCQSSFFLLIRKKKEKSNFDCSFFFPVLPRRSQPWADEGGFHLFETGQLRKILFGLKGEGRKIIFGRFRIHLSRYFVKSLRKKRPCG
jgi:hypothetical protein